MTKIIGLTGGIGSGKTWVANYLKSLGIPVYIADDEAKLLMDSDEIVQQLSNQFGNEILTENKIDRKKLSQLVFNNPEALQKLNSIVHPLVKRHFDNWVEHHNQFDFVVKEAAILFESGSYKYCDKIITVTAPLETRIERIIKRDNTDKRSVLARIQNQWDDEKKIALSDFIIHNINIEDTKQQVDSILKLLKNQQY